MSKELIERLNESIGTDLYAAASEAADLIEQLQAENERNQLDNASLAHRLDSARSRLATAEKLIEHLEFCLTYSDAVHRKHVTGEDTIAQSMRMTQEALAAAKQWKEIKE